MRCLVVMLLLVLVGCTQPVSPPPSSPTVAPSSPSVSPTPTPTCSPMGGTPRPCSREEYQKVEEQNRLTEEAIALYRRWTKESTRLYRAGGTDEPTKEMLATTAGEFRKSALGVFRDLKSAGVKATTGEVQIVQIGVDVSAPAIPGMPAVSACLDGRSLKFQRNGKFLRDGIAFKEYIVAKPISGQLRLWSVSSEVVETC